MRMVSVHCPEPRHFMTVTSMKHTDTPTQHRVNLAPLLSVYLDTDIDRRQHRANNQTNTESSDNINIARSIKLCIVHDHKNSKR